MMEKSKPGTSKVSPKDCGTLEGKEKNVFSHFPSCKTVSDKKSEPIFGFIVIDGNGVLFGKLQGNTQKVLHKFSADLPKKQGKGGLDAKHLACLRLEKRIEYLKKAAKIATQLFISNDKSNVTGLILAGSANVKAELNQSPAFDAKLKVKVIKIVDVSNGGESGFRQAIELTAQSLENFKFDQEKKLLDRFFDEIRQDSGKYCFGVEDTLRGMELGAVETLICSEQLDVNRYVLKNVTTGRKTILYLTSEQERDTSHFSDKESGVALKIVKCQRMLEWLSNNYMNFGATLNTIKGDLQESSDFLQGYGGIGGILRYKVDFQSFQMDNNEESD